MTSRPSSSIRNVALIGHGGTGKTSLAEALLFRAGAISRLGRVEDGTTTSDWDPEEQRRQFSINLSILPLEWEGHKVNLIDTPGYPDFLGEVICGLRAADAALVVIDVTSGVQVGTELTWRLADERRLPRAVFLSRMDRENADFASALAQVQQVWGQRCLPLQLPIGSQQDFQGVVDLLSMRAYLGDKDQEDDIPAALQEEAQSYREKLVEAAAESDDELLARYLEGEELTAEEIVAGLRRAILAGSLVPVLVGSCTRLLGMGPLLSAICRLFPSPAELPCSTEEGEELVADPDGPLAALVFKTTADPYVGRLSYFRVFSGTLRADSQVWNPRKQALERIGPVYQVRGKGQAQVPQVTAGDLGAVAKLTETVTGDTLSSRERPLVLPGIVFPEPAFSAAIHPKGKADLDKMSSALQRIVDEDPSLRLERNPDTGETLLSGLGDAHVEVALEKIKRKFGVELEMAVPRVPYRETIMAQSTAEYTHKKQTGGHGQYARVAIRLEPLPRGAGFEFVDQIVGGAIPKQFIPSVEKGVQEAMQEGVLAHYPLTDLRVVLFDGKDHPVDSSDIAFKIAAAHALRKGALDARPVLLEPIMRMRITVPDANTGDIISDLNSKRARVLGMSPAGPGLTTVEALAPLAEVQRYAADLRSLTQGRGYYTMSFDHYEEVPAHIAQRIIEQAQREREAQRA
ncbi:Elongation factor G [bacterium HR25]|nr:Elongation factor G [bacterium HR25]